MDRSAIKNHRMSLWLLVAVGLCLGGCDSSQPAARKVPGAKSSASAPKADQVVSPAAPPREFRLGGNDGGGAMGASLLPIPTHRTSQVPPGADEAPLPAAISLDSWRDASATEPLPPTSPAATAEGLLAERFLAIVASEKPVQGLNPSNVVDVTILPKTGAVAAGPVVRPSVRPSQRSDEATNHREASAEESSQRPTPHSVVVVPRREEVETRRPPAARPGVIAGPVVRPAEIAGSAPTATLTMPPADAASDNQDDPATIASEATVDEPALTIREQWPPQRQVEPPVARIVEIAPPAAVKPEPPAPTNVEEPRIAQRPAAGPAYAPPAPVVTRPVPPATPSTQKPAAEAIVEAPSRPSTDIDAEPAPSSVVVESPVTMEPAPSVATVEAPAVADAADVAESPDLVEPPVQTIAGQPMPRPADQSLAEIRVDESPSLPAELPVDEIAQVERTKTETPEPPHALADQADVVEAPPSQVAEVAPRQPASERPEVREFEVETTAPVASPTIEEVADVPATVAKNGMRDELPAAEDVTEMMQPPRPRRDQPAVDDLVAKPHAPPVEPEKTVTAQPLASEPDVSDVAVADAPAPRESVVEPLPVTQEESLAGAPTWREAEPPAARFVEPPAAPATIPPTRRFVAAPPVVGEPVAAAPPRLPVDTQQTSELERVSRLAAKHTRKGFELGGRSAMFSARAEFIQALRIVAESLDALERTSVHSEAMAAALRALTESEDFVCRGSDVFTSRDVERIALAHKTPVMHQARPEEYSALIAQQRYYTYAQEQFAIAGGRQPAASIALYGLGKIYGALETTGSSRLVALEPKAMVCHQAALLIDQRNYMAANELGVILVRYGRYEQARDAFHHGLAFAASPSLWHNIAVVHYELGNPRAAQFARQEAVAAATRAPGREAPSSGANQVQWVDPATFASLPVDRAGMNQPLASHRPTEMSPSPGEPPQRETTPAMPEPPSKKSAWKLPWQK